MMNFYASGQKPAFKIRRQSTSQTPAVDEIRNRGYDWEVMGRSGIVQYNFEDGKTRFERFVKDADFRPPIGDNRRIVRDHWVNGPDLRRWAPPSLMAESLNQQRELRTSPSSSTSFPTRTAWTIPKVQQKGPQFLSGIGNKHTISKDNTVGEEEKMNDLLATYGKRVMGIKHQEQHEVTSPGKRLQIGWGSQYNGNILVFESLEGRPQVLRTNTGDSYIDPSNDEDGMLNNTSLLLAEDDHESQGEYNGFVVPNMNGDQWINPTVVPYFTTDREDTVPRQMNGIDIRLKEKLRQAIQNGRDRSQRREK